MLTATQHLLVLAELLWSNNYPKQYLNIEKKNLFQIFKAIFVQLEQ